MLVEGHEGKDKDVDKLLKKYKIPEKDQAMAKGLLFALKDADALDRARLTLNIDIPLLPIDAKVITDLDPKYLRSTTAKSLMEFSYGLEYVSYHMQNQFGEILNYKNQRRGEHYTPKSITAQEDFIPKVEIKEQLPQQKQVTNKDINRQSNMPSIDDDL